MIVEKNHQLKRNTPIQTLINTSIDQNLKVNDQNLKVVTVVLKYFWQGYFLY